MRASIFVALAILVSTIGCERPAEYSIASVDAIVAPFDEAQWERVEALGTTVGPFKGLGDHGLGAGANKKKVFYTLAGTRIEKDLDLPEEVLIRRFENPQGDSLVIVYKRRPVAN